jgi:hypothetical protein
MWQLWLSAIIGLWFVISPWVFDFVSNSGAMWNSIVFGAIVFILTAWKAITDKYDDKNM